MEPSTANPYMATTSTTRIPPITEVHDTPPTLPQPHPPPSKTTVLVKQEPQELPIANNPPQETSENPQIQNSLFCYSEKVTEMRNLSVFLSSFFRRYDELQVHLDFIRSKLPEQNLKSDPSPQLSQPPIVPVETTLSPPSTEATVAELPISEGLVGNTDSCLSEMESCCKSMSSRGLYNYILSHILEIGKIREEAQTALKLAPNPAKLVLECLAYGKDSPRVEEREASVLILEIFLLMGGNNDDIEVAVKEEAEAMAVEWRNRLITEDGVVKKGFEIHARGLLLLVGCFGIPIAFKDENVRELILVSNSKEISESLRRSKVLLARIPGIVEEMMKKQMVVKAVDIACTFGLESKYHPRLCLQNFLQASRDTCVEEKKVARSEKALKEANKKHLADLKSALECLEDHAISPFMPGWKIPNLISNLQRDIALLDTKIRLKVTQKRQADELESSKNLTNREVKRARVNHGKSSREGLMPTNLLNGGIRGRDTFSVSSPELHVLPAGPYPAGPGVHGGMLVDGVNQVISNNGQPYGWHERAQFKEGLIGPKYTDPALSMGGQMGGMLVDNFGQVANNYTQPYGWHGDASMRERVIGHSYHEPAPPGANGLFRVAPSMHGFVGLLNPSSVGTSKQRSDSDLYRFADTIL